MNRDRTPRVSVVIPTYNRADLLPRAVKSVLAQTFSDFELIIIDDGSTDDTRDSIQPLLADARVKYLFQKNAGQSAATNVGIREARAPYVALLDSDDEWLPEKLSHQMAVFEKNPSIGAVFCWLIMVDESTHAERVMKIEEGNILKAPEAAKTFVRDAARRTWFSNPSTMVFRKSATTFFDERLIIANDIDFTIVLLTHNDFFCVQEPLVRYYVHGGNISRLTAPEKKLRLAEQWDAVIGKHKDIFSAYKDAYGTFLRGVGSYFLLAGKRKIAFDHFVMAAKLSPWTLKNYLFMALVLPGGSFWEFLLIMKDKVK